MVAMEANYHAKCLASLYNRARLLKTGPVKDVEISGPNLESRHLLSSLSISKSDGTLKI